MRTMYDKIDFEIKRAKRFGRSLGCIMMDMDHFKNVNDFNDHLFGSFVLKETGEIIKRIMREVDFGACYGGDEFLMVLTETSAKGVQVFCERLRSEIEGHEFNDGKNKMKLTISMGFAVIEGDAGIGAKEFVRQADHALYDAKERGRNQFAQFSGERNKDAKPE